MFRTVLLAHIAMGTLGLLLGPVVMFARKRPGVHTHFGEIYHWVMLGICASACTLALLAWEQFWAFLYIGIGSYAFALLGYVSAKIRWRHWLGAHILGQGGSYIAIITAVAVVNWRTLLGWSGLSEPWPWALPTIVGTPMIGWLIREVVLGRRPKI